MAALASASPGQNLNPAPQGGGGSPYSMAGNIPFNSGGNPFGGDLAGSYQSSYNSALQQNQALYQNILGGYNQTMQNQVGAQGSIQQRYDNLGGQVMNTIQGVDASQRQAIADTYAQQQGSAQQGLINSGLGNSTVLSSVNRGLGLDEQKANIALSNQTAQLQAGYQAQLGSASASYANQATQQNTALAGQELNWMNTVSAQYPNAQAYGQLQYNQGLMNALNSRAGMQGVSAGGGGGYNMQRPPISPGGAGPSNYGSIYTGGGSPLGGYGAPANVPYQNPYGAPPPQQASNNPYGTLYAGTNQDQYTDPNAITLGGPDTASA